MKLSKLSVVLVSLGLVSSGLGCGNNAPTQKDSASSTATSRSLEKAAGASIGDKPSKSADADAKPESGAKAGRNDDAIGEEDDLKSNRIFFETVHTVPSDPGLIRPCIKIRSALYRKAQAGKDFEVDFVMTYTSRGESVTKTITVKLSEMSPEQLESDMMIDDGSGGKKKEKYVELMANVSISDHPIDKDSRVTGSAKLYKAKGTSRTDGGEAQLPQ